MTKLATSETTERDGPSPSPPLGPQSQNDTVTSLVESVSSSPTNRPSTTPMATGGEEAAMPESWSEKDQHDGHRPHDSEIEKTRARTTGRDDSTATATLRRAASRRDSAIAKIRSRPEVAPFTHPLAQCPTTEDQVVDFDGPDDPYRPLNWPRHKKWTTTLLYAFVTMTATWASSALSAGVDQIAEEFHVSLLVATLGTSLYLMGFGIGPLLWAPVSEVYGRRVAVLTPMVVAICFTFASATAENFQTLILSRFFGALFASAPVTNTGGVLGDLFSPAERGVAMAGYTMAVFGGPCIGPIVSAAVADPPSLGWRWTEYVTGILQSVVLLFAVLFIDESYPPRLLVGKARRLRHETGNWALHARFEEWDVGVGELARKFLLRPLQLLTSPICCLIALYASFCYGILYMQLGAVPLIFGEVRGWTGVNVMLPFLAIFLGAMTGAAANVANQLVYNKAYRAAGERAVPEMRLPPMMIGSFLFAGGMFLTGWTADPDDAHWIVPVIGLYLTGCGFNTIFQAALNYLVDTFHMYAASAIAANTFLRSCFAAAFPIIVRPLYNNLGVGPGSSIFAGFGTLLIPVPFVFYVFGRRVRAGNKWSKGSVY